jgi:hypothetical protein
MCRYLAIGAFGTSNESVVCDGIHLSPLVFLEKYWHVAFRDLGNECRPPLDENLKSNEGGIREGVRVPLSVRGDELDLEIRPIGLRENAGVFSPEHLIQNLSQFLTDFPDSKIRMAHNHPLWHRLV